MISMRIKMFALNSMEKKCMNKIGVQGGVSNAKFETPPKGLGRFRRESSNLGREAYKGTSSPKVGDRKSPY